MCHTLASIVGQRLAVCRPTSRSMLCWQIVSIRRTADGPLVTLESLQNGQQHTVSWSVLRRLLRTNAVRRVERVEGTGTVCAEEQDHD